MPVNANDSIALDDVEVEEIKEDPNQEKKNSLYEIVTGATAVEFVNECEGCGEPLDTPIILTYDGSEGDERDSSILCKADCAS